MRNQLIESTPDVKTNILMAADFLNEQKRLLRKEVKRMNEVKAARETMGIQITAANEEIEVKGEEKELLIKEIENLLKVRLEKDVVLIETGQTSNRFIRCIYPENRTTLHQFLEDFSTVFHDGLSQDQREDPITSLLEHLHHKKVLKKDYKPYSSSVSKGFYEEKPARIFLDSNKNAIRVETEVYITAAGANRLRLKELKPILVAANSI